VPGIPGCKRKASSDLVDAVRRARRAVRAEGGGEAPRTGPAGDQGSHEGAPAKGEGHGGDGGLARAAKKMANLLLGGHGRLTSCSVSAGCSADKGV